MCYRAVGVGVVGVGGCGCDRDVGCYIGDDGDVVADIGVRYGISMGAGGGGHGVVVVPGIVGVGGGAVAYGGVGYVAGCDDGAVVVVGVGDVADGYVGIVGSRDVDVVVVCVVVSGERVCLWRCCWW